MDLLDQDVASRVALAMSEACVSLGQIVARTGLDEAELTAALAAAVPFTTADLVLVACALGCHPGHFVDPSLSRPTDRGVA